MTLRQYILGKTSTVLHFHSEIFLGPKYSQVQAYYHKSLDIKIKKASKNNPFANQVQCS